MLSLSKHLSALHSHAMNRLYYGDNLKPKRSEAESDETPLSSAANAAVSFLPQWLRDTKPSSEGKL